MSRTAHIRGAEYHDILHMIADGHIPYSIIAAKWGRHKESIGNFASQHQEEIDAIIADHAAKLSENWLMIKDLRCRELADIYEPLKDRYVELAEREEKSDRDTKLMANISGKLAMLLKQAAEEAGDLPSRAPNQGPAPGAVGWEIERDA